MCQLSRNLGASTEISVDFNREHKGKRWDDNIKIDSKESACEIVLC
jgi:hypothetical protein